MKFWSMIRFWNQNILSIRRGQSFFWFKWNNQVFNIEQNAIFGNSKQKFYSLRSEINWKENFEKNKQEKIQKRFRKIFRVEMRMHFFTFLGWKLQLSNLKQYGDTN